MFLFVILVKNIINLRKYNYIIAINNNFCIKTVVIQKKESSTATILLTT